MSSIISPLAARAIQIQQKIHSYISHYIFYFILPPDNLISLEKRPWSWKLLPWCLSFISITGFLGLGSILFVATTQILHLPVKEEAHLYNTVIIVGLRVCTILQLITVYGGIINPHIFQNFKAFLEFHRKCVAALPANNQRLRRTDILGMLFACIATTNTLAPPSVAPVAILTHLDPFYYLFEEFLPHPYHRPIWLIVGVPLLRMFLGWYFLAELVNFGAMFLFTIMPPIFAVISSAKHLRSIYGDRCLLLYMELRLHFAELDYFMSNTSLILVVFAQVGTVSLCWLVVKCGKIFPLYIVILICILIVYFLFIAALLLPAMAKIRKEIRALIRMKLNLHYCTNRMVKNRRYYYSVWKAQESLYVMCGSFFPFQYGITQKYFYELVNNLVNAVILINPY